MAVITTPGAPDADSYLTDAEADAIATALGIVWHNGVTNREVELRRATAWLDAAYRSQWPGTRLNGRGQALEWPRSDAYDCAGELIDSATIPEEIKRAVVYAAAYEIDNAGTLTPFAVPSEAVKREKVDVIEVEYVGRVGGDAWRVRIAGVEDALSGILCDTGRGGTKFLDRA